MFIKYHNYVIFLSTVIIITKDLQLSYDYGYNILTNITNITQI